jgi:hypothetical protein
LVWSDDPETPGIVDIRVAGANVNDRDRLTKGLASAMIVRPKRGWELSEIADFSTVVLEPI